RLHFSCQPRRAFLIYTPVSTYGDTGRASTGAPGESCYSGVLRGKGGANRGVVSMTTASLTGGRPHGLRAGAGPAGAACEPVLVRRHLHPGGRPETFLPPS